jgi:hypothetical protein
MQQGNGPDQNPSPQHQPQHPHQQQWVPHMQQQQQQWMAAMQYPAAAMAMMQQQMMMYPHQQHHHYMAYYQQQQHQHQQYQNKQQQYHQKQQKQLQQQGSNEEAKTIWVGDLLHWMDEAYLHNCFSHTGEVYRFKLFAVSVYFSFYLYLACGCIRDLFFVFFFLMNMRFKIFYGLKVSYFPGFQ